MRSLCGIVLLAGLSAAQDPLSAELETPGQRRKAALELAGRKDVTLDQWIAGKLVYPERVTSHRSTTVHSRVHAHHHGRKR